MKGLALSALIPLAACETPDVLLDVDVHQDFVEGAFDSDTGTCAEAPASTSLMQYKWSEARTRFESCRSSAAMDRKLCVHDVDAQSVHTVDECRAVYDQAIRECAFFHNNQVNVLPLRECGAEIFTDISSPGGVYDYEFNVGEDTDGDGVSNWHEYKMGMNPCDAHSFGTCQEHDGAADYDADGIPNAEDEDPLCNDFRSGQDLNPDPAYDPECFNPI